MIFLFSSIGIPLDNPLACLFKRISRIFLEKIFVKAGSPYLSPYSENTLLFLVRIEKPLSS